MQPPTSAERAPRLAGRAQPTPNAAPATLASEREFAGNAGGAGRTISPGGPEESAGLYWIDVNESAGSGVRLTNVRVPPPMRESLRHAEQNLYTRAQQLVGDRNPKLHELTVQMRALDASKSGADLGLPALIALASALIGKSLHGGMIRVGGINLGGGIETIYNAASIVELAAEKGATSLLMPVATRRDVMNVSDEIAAKVDVRFYTDARDAFLKAISD
ncbi:MAG: hypothetical protein M3464_12740 [Chloroflexota bacterium]|nr:hypothetical protein [Chloroflexota bacterium]